MKIVAFSDWRNKKVRTFLEYLGNLKEKPDLILYAGDDIQQINRVNSTLSFFLFNSVKFNHA